jgi:hypothetical protein
MNESEMNQLEKFSQEQELELYQEYREIIDNYQYIVETERRFYMCNQVDMQAKSTVIGDQATYFEVIMEDVWVWDIYRKNRKLKQAHVCTFKDVNIEEIGHFEE